MCTIVCCCVAMRAFLIRWIDLMHIEEISNALFALAAAANGVAAGFFL